MAAGIGWLERNCADLGLKRAAIRSAARKVETDTQVRNKKGQRGVRMRVRCEDRSVHVGREACSAGARLARHRHHLGYIAIVLEGGYLEAGDVGRVRVGPGHMLIHRPFEAHLDEFGLSGAEVLNLPLPRAEAGWTICSVADPDEIVRVAEGDAWAAARLALLRAQGGPEPEADWPDLLAAELRRGAVPCLYDWGLRHGLTAPRISRGFRQAYGVTPVRYRSESRARMALEAISTTSDRLADIALDAGFADQSHMTREVVALTGRPPRTWRLALRH